jgi:hypothetical protein
MKRSVPQTTRTCMRWLKPSSSGSSAQVVAATGVSGKNFGVLFMPRRPEVHAEFYATVHGTPRSNHSWSGQAMREEIVSLRGYREIPTVRN